jgi:hypothetical protein
VCSFESLIKPREGDAGIRCIEFDTLDKDPPPKKVI